MSKPEIFVFGSNLSGIHGAGAARYAWKNLGAKWGVGEGATGSCYAIPTKEKDVHTPRTLSEVRFSVDKFLQCSRTSPNFNFKVTRIGCGLAGFRDENIAPLFANAPDNCFFDSAWEPLLPAGKKFWGTF